MAARITKRTQIQLSSTRIPVGELYDLLTGVSRSAIVQIDYTDFSGSWDPRESSYVTLTIEEPS